MNSRQETAALEQAGVHRNLGQIPAQEPRLGLSPEGERPFFNFDLARALQLHRKLFLSIALCGVVLAAAYVIHAWPVYLAESRVYVQPAPASVMQSQSNAPRWPFDSNTYDSYIQQQVQNASNPAVLVAAANKIPSWKRAGEPDVEAAARLGRAVEVARLGNSYEVGITARAHDPQQAAQVANALAAELAENSVLQQNAGDQQRQAILRDERTRVQNQLNADVAEQGDLSRQLGMASAGTSGGALLDGAIGTAHDELIKARAEHDQAVARFSALDANKGVSSAALRAEADEIIAADPGLNSMKTSLNQRRAILISQMANLKPENPAYKMDAAELAKINGSLESMTDELRSKAALRAQQKLRSDLERTAGVEARLNGQLRQLSATAAGASPKLQRANDLAADIVRLRSRYAAVDDELRNLVLKDSTSGAVHLSMAAVAPLHPAVFVIARKAVPLALGGIVLGLLIVLVVNNLDQKIYIAADVEQLLGAVPMATLPSSDEVSDAVFSEYVFRFSSALERNVYKAGLKNCLFTSACAEAGTSTLVARTSETLRSMGWSTTLVDASSGGPVPPMEAEMEGKRVVLTDAGPLAVSAQSEYLARMANSVIVVVKSGVTTRAQLRAVAGMIERMNGPAVGFVLNQVKMAQADRPFRDSVKAAEKHMRTQRPRHSLFARPEAVAEPEAEPMMEQTSQKAVLPSTEPVVAALKQPEEEPLELPLVAQNPEQNMIPVETARAQSAPEPRWKAAPVEEVKAAAVGSGTPKPVQQVEPQAAPHRPEPEPFAQKPFPQARPEPPVAPRKTEAAAKPVPPPAFEPAPKPAAQKTSRLSGLRGAMFERGLVHLNFIEESEQKYAEAAVVPQPEAFSEPVRMRSASARVADTEKTHSPQPVAQSVVREVVAEPEFLPPREFIPFEDDAESAEGVGEVGHDRRNPFDDLEILPSWRGQYRRK